MPLNPAQLEILGDKIIIIADIIALVAAQGEVGAPSDNTDNSKEDNQPGKLTPDQLNILSAWLTVVGDGLALLAALQPDN